MNEDGDALVPGRAAKQATFRRGWTGVWLLCQALTNGGIGVAEDLHFFCLRGGRPLVEVEVGS